MFMCSINLSLEYIQVQQCRGQHHGCHHLIRDQGCTPVVIAPVQTVKETLLVFKHHYQCCSQLEDHHQFQIHSSVVHQKHFLQLDSQSFLKHVIQNAINALVICSLGYLMDDNSGYLTFHSILCLNVVHEYNEGKTSDIHREDQETDFVPESKTDCGSS